MSTLTFNWSAQWIRRSQYQYTAPTACSPQDKDLPLPPAHRHEHSRIDNVYTGDGGCRGTLMYAAHQVVRLELVVLKGLVKVGQALVDDWQGGAADVEEKRPGDAVCMAVALPFASRASSPTPCAPPTASSSTSPMCASSRCLSIVHMHVSSLRKVMHVHGIHTLC